MACLSWGCLFLFEELAEGAPETPLGLVPRVVVAEGCLLIVILLAEPGVVFCMELLKGKRQFNQHLQPHILVPFSLSLCARRDLVGEEVLARLGDNRSLRPQQQWYLCRELVAGSEAVAKDWKDKHC